MFACICIKDLQTETQKLYYQLPPQSEIGGLLPGLRGTPTFHTLLSYYFTFLNHMHILLFFKKRQCSFYLSIHLSINHLFILFSTWCCDVFQILGFVHCLSGEYHCIMDEEETLMGSSYDFAVTEQ